jgi:hypothetical protein
MYFVSEKVLPLQKYLAPRVFPHLLPTINSLLIDEKVITSFLIE